MGAEDKQEGKIFYKIGEVADITRLPTYVLRFWESEFHFLRPRKSRGRHRVYTKADIETVREIRRMLYDEGYTIAGLKRSWYRRKSVNDSPKVPIEKVQKVRAELQAILKILDLRSD